MTATTPWNCHLNGHAFTLFSDGSQECAVCKLYLGPNPAQVNALLNRAAAARAYGSGRFVMPKAPPLPIPTELPPPVLPGMPSGWALLPIAVFGLTCLAFLFGVAVRYIVERVGG